MTPGEPRPQRPAPAEAGPGIKIARPFGIPVFISPYWFLVAGLFVLFYADSFRVSPIHQAWVRYVVAAAFVILLFASVLFGRGRAANARAGGARRAAIRAGAAVPSRPGASACAGRTRSFAAG